MEICIRLIDMPGRCHAMTMRDSDGFYNIYINAGIGYWMQRKAVRHEVGHIKRGDFDRESVGQIETYAHFYYG